MNTPDQRFYDMVADEIRSRSLVDGLWVRSISEAGGEATKARAIYISYRVEQLKAVEAAGRAAAFQQAQAQTRREQEQRERVKRETKEKRARELEAARHRPLDPQAKRLLVWLLLIVLALFFVFILLPLLIKFSFYRY